MGHGTGKAALEKPSKINVGEIIQNLIRNAPASLLKKPGVKFEGVLAGGAGCSFRGGVAQLIICLSNLWVCCWCPSAYHADGMSNKAEHFLRNL